MQAYLESIVAARGGPPSLSVAVAVGDDVVLAAAAGLADPASGRLATPDTVYRTYSISKGITAVAVMQLVEAGAVGLDDDVRDYVPEFPPKRWPVRVEHLLTHTSGIRHYREGAGEISSQREYASLAESLVVFGDDPLGFEPGTDHLYSSFGFNLLSGVVERAAGVPFEAWLRERVWDPAGMTRTRLHRAGVEIPGFAAPHWPPLWRFGSNRPIEQLPNVSGRYGSSGVVSTPTDLVRLFVALRGGTLLGPETLEKMYSTPFPEIAPTQAYGWNRDDDDGRRAIYRSGAGTGFSGLLLHYPEEGVTGALLTNQNQFQGRVAVLGRVLEPFLAGQPVE